MANYNPRNPRHPRLKNPRRMAKTPKNLFSSICYNMSKSTIGSTGLIAFDDAKVGHKITFFEQSERRGTRKE